jgi:hypothetical protein
MPESQHYANHVRRATPLEYSIAIALLVNLLLATYRLVQRPGIDQVVQLVTAAALLALLWAVRAQIVTVQDRVIRNEMRERLRRLLVPDLAARAEVLPVKQLVALRFAGDGELPELIGEVLAGRLTSPKEIKMRVRNWQADYLRC